MQNGRRKVGKLRGIKIAVILLACIFVLLLDFIDIPFSKEEFRRRTLTKIVQQGVGSILAIYFVLHMGLRVFKKPQNWLYLLPCLLVALNNFQWSAFFSGKMQLARKSPLDFLLFATYCLTTGLFEELVFRGILFATLAGVFQENKKGFLCTYFFSSLLFGLCHLFNGFSGETLLQVGYSVLTGGLFAFCLIKTGNILCCALVHGLYNFCGLLYDTQGLGYGVVFDLGTVLSMSIIGVIVGVFVLYKIWNYPEEERASLYATLGINVTKEK